MGVALEICDLGLDTSTVIFFLYLRPVWEVIIISACCNKRLKSAGGYMWSFDAKDWVERYENTIHSHFSKRKSVLQYTKENKLVGKYENLSDAQRQTGVGRLTISRVCNGVQEYGGGFIWKFAS